MAGSMAEGWYGAGAAGESLHPDPQAERANWDSGLSGTSNPVTHLLQQDRTYPPFLKSVLPTVMNPDTCCKGPGAMEMKGVEVMGA